MLLNGILKDFQTLADSVDGNAAANTSLIQRVRRYRNQVTLLDSKSFSMTLLTSIFDPHFLALCFTSHVFSAFSGRCTDLGCGTKRMVSAISFSLEPGQW